MEADVGLGLDMGMVLKSFFAFCFVMSLMFLLSWALKRYGFPGRSILPGGKRRLQVIEQIQIDQRRKLILIRRDDREYLIVAGPGGETVVESGIPLADNIVELPPQKDKKHA